MTDLREFIVNLTSRQLGSLINLKESMKTLEDQREKLEKDIEQINGKITSVLESITSLIVRDEPPKDEPPKEEPPKKRGRPAGKTGKEPVQKKKAGKKAKKTPQPSLATLVSEAMKEKGKPLGAKDLTTILIEEKGYRTKSKDFNATLRVMLSKNKGLLFKSVGKGLYTLIEEDA